MVSGQQIFGTVRVVSTTEDGLYVRAPNGTEWWIPGGGNTYEPDEILHVRDLETGEVEKAPDSAWPGAHEAGVVEIVEDAQVWIRRGDYLIKARKDADLQVKRGWVVEYIPTLSVTRVVKKNSKSLRPSAHHDERTERTDVKKFRQKPKKSWPSPEDFVGSPHLLRQARDLIELPFQRRELFEKIGAPMIKGVLFSGPPGTGKTMLAKIIAREVDATLYIVNGADVGDMYYGNSEKIVQNIFAAAARDERAIVFFDELDSIAPARGKNTHDVERRVVTALLTAMGGVDANPNVTVIATTNRPESLDSALTRIGRFDRVIDFAPPTLQQRVELMKKSSSRFSEGGVDFDGIDFDHFAAKTEGWSGAEIAGVWREAMYVTVRDHRGRIIEEDYARGVEIVAEQRAIRARDEEQK